MDAIKSLQETFNWLWSSLNVILMPHMLPTSRSEEIGDYCPVLYNAFPWSAQSAEKIQNTLQLTERKRQFVVHEGDRSCSLYFLWLEAGGKFSIFCVYGQICTVHISSVFLSLYSKTKQNCFHEMLQI